MEGGEKICAIIPAFGEGPRIGGVVAGVLAKGLDAVVVDDASRDDTAERAREAGATVLEHVQNRGKGMALFTGFEYAEEAGYELALTMDGDGRHDPSDIPALLAAHRRTGAALVLGNRMDAPGEMPRARRWANRWMSRALSRIMRQAVPDAMCGFRLYHKSAFPKAAPSRRTRRFAAEAEFLVRVVLDGGHVVSVPVRCPHGEECGGLHAFADAWRFRRLLGYFGKMERSSSLERSRR